MIEIHGLSLNLGNFSLKDIHLEILPGEYFVIMGPSGSGKTTLLQTILGIRKPDSGRILIQGRDVTRSPPEARGLGYVPQHLGLFPHLSVRENIEYGLRLRKIPRSQMHSKVSWIAEIMGISQILERDIGNLSGGEAQRVCLARALVIQPKAVLLDEPLGLLDAINRDRLQSFLKQLHSELKFTAIHVTHDFNEAAFLGNRLGIMHSGRILQVGNLEQILDDPMDPIVAEITGAQNLIRGKILGREGELIRIQVSDVEMYGLAPSNLSSNHVLVGISSRQIAIQKSHPDQTSARNCISMHISELIPTPEGYRVVLEHGELKLRALVSTQVKQQLNLRPGIQVYAVFEPSGVKVFC